MPNLAHANENRAELEALGSAVALPAGATLVTEGDAASHLFMVRSGMLKLYRLLPDGRRQVIRFLFPGDLLGRPFEERHSASAEALGPVSLAKLPRAGLEALLARAPLLQRRLLGAASSELAAAHDQMLLLGRKTARERVASFLVMMVRRAAARGHDPRRIALAMTRTDIADYLGLTIETVSRTFTQLRRVGVIEIAATGAVEVADAGELAGLAEAA